MNIVLRTQIIGIIIILILGTLLHYIYRWSGNNPCAALFGAVNNSIWEHIKLIIWPTVLMIIIRYFILKTTTVPNFWVSAAAQLFLPILFVPIIYYFTLAVLGYSHLILDIGNFLFSILIAGMISYKLMCIPEVEKNGDLAGIILCLIIVFAFSAFTYHPPRNFLFKDPGGSYGVPSKVK